MSHVMLSHFPQLWQLTWLWDTGKQLLTTARTYDPYTSPSTLVSHVISIVNCRKYCSKQHPIKVYNNNARLADLMTL